VETIDLHLQRLRQVGDTPIKPCEYLSDKFIPIPPHKVGIAHLVLKPRFLLADPTGCGKTPQSLAAFGFLKQRDAKVRMLVMAERSAIFQWKESVLKFLTGIRPQIIGYDLDSGSALTRHQRYALYEGSGADVLVLSYHQMARDIDVILRNVDNYIVVYDEVQHLKSHTGKSLYPAAQKLSMKGRYVWGLTATPIMNRLEELYSIMEVIRPGTFGSYETFANRFLERNWMDLRGNILTRDEANHPALKGKVFWKVTGEKNIPELMKVMRPFFLRRRAIDIDKHLPIVVSSPRLIEMDSKQAALYEEIRKGRFPATVERKARGLRKFAALIYAQLVADAPELAGLEGSSAKITELIRIMTEEVNGEKVIIYSRFRRSVDLICSTLAKLGIPHARITGKEGTKEREDAKIRFNTSSDVNTICINKAGGTSLDLQQAKILIFFDLPWSWGERDQVRGRTRRIGSPHEKVLEIPLICNNTIDQHVYSVLEDKESLVERTFGVSPTSVADRDVTEYLFNVVLDKVA
jgi:SNF2 family DNA or RNA helicase